MRLQLYQNGVYQKEWLSSALPRSSSLTAFTWDLNLASDVSRLIDNTHHFVLGGTGCHGSEVHVDNTSIKFEFEAYEPEPEPQPQPEPEPEPGIFSTSSSLLRSNPMNINIINEYVGTPGEVIALEYNNYGQLQDSFNFSQAAITLGNPTWNRPNSSSGYMSILDCAEILLGLKSTGGAGQKSKINIYTGDPDTGGTIADTYVIEHMLTSQDKIDIDGLYRYTSYGGITITAVNKPYTTLLDYIWIRLDRNFADIDGRYWMTIDSDPDVL